MFGSLDFQKKATNMALKQKSIFISSPIFNACEMLRPSTLKEEYLHISKLCLNSFVSLLKNFPNELGGNTTKDAIILKRSHLEKKLSKTVLRGHAVYELKIPL
mgnify:FL=1